MAGHNKWSKIKHKKAKNDIARAAAHSKAARAIINASKACGGDMSNLHLQSCVAHAKAIELPKTKIQDAIDRHHNMSKDASSKDAEYVRYDAMVTCGGTKVAVIATALTDNRKRTAAQVRAMVAKMGGEVLPSEKLNFFFERKGVALVNDVVGAEQQEALLEAAVEAGAIDVHTDDDDDDDNNENANSAVVVCSAEDLWHMVTALREAGYTVDEFEHRYLLNDPATMAVDLSEDGVEDLERFLTAMEENEDVTQVYHNAAVEY